MKLLQELKRRVFILDGAMGTEILKRTGRKVPLGELLNVEDPQIVYSIHRDYVEAGADIIETNTFSANPFKLKESGIPEAMLNEIIKRGVHLAKEAAGDEALVSGSIGPLGKLLYPLGDITWEQVYDTYYRLSSVMADEGVDLIQIETQIDVEEAKIAVLAAREATNLPVIVSITFTEEGRTVTGSDPETAFSILERTGADILSVNCGREVEEFLEFVDILSTKGKPFAVYPNAGLPRRQGDSIVFPMGPEEFLGFAEQFFKKGASILGGCCGTTPEHIRLIAKNFKGRKPISKKGTKFFFAASRTKLVPAGTGFPFMKIGERINPYGSKKIKPFIENRDVEEIARVAVEQQSNGADAIDINLGLQGEKDPDFFAETLLTVSTRVNVPVFVDVKNPASIKEALKATPGRPVINSCSGERQRMEEVLPLVRRFSSGVVAIAIDDRGVAETVKDKLRILENFLKVAESYGLTPADIIFDPVVLSVSTGSEGVRNTLEAIKEAKRAFNIPVILGLSNVSYGMPKRKWLNLAFLSMAICMGADAAILRVENEELVSSLYASEFLCGKSRRYIEIFGKRAEVSVMKRREARTEEEALKIAILEGSKNEAFRLTESLLKRKAPLEVLNEILIPAMKEVGDLYEKKIYFLPQLIASAEAMKKASSLIEKNLKGKGEKKWKILLATVKGDLHDIGKNIVKAVLSNFGFNVIDLGKNVPLERIMEEIDAKKPDIVGLSCLMTTTLEEMERAVREIKRKYPGLPVIIGGATVSPRLAREFGADAYGKDAVDALRKAKSLLEE